MFGMYVLRNLLVIQNILLNILNYAMMVILAAVFSFVNHFYIQWGVLDVLLFIIL